MRPKRASAWRTASRAASGSVTSRGNASARAGAFSISQPTAAGLRAVATTRSPFCRAARLTARPKPLDAPVTNQMRWPAVITMCAPSFHRQEVQLWCRTCRRLLGHYGDGDRVARREGRLERLVEQPLEVLVARPLQQTIDLVVAENRRGAQRRLAFAIGDARIGAGGEQLAHFVHVAAEDR